MRKGIGIMFEGTYTAIVTPFTRDGHVDYPRLQDLIERQVAAGITGVVPMGTTGESPTLDMKEHAEVVARTVTFANHRLSVLAGTGGNSTTEAIDLTRQAQQAGADGTLQVTPYYNKPSQEGLYRHFSAVADIGLPVVLYNVPSRTVREIAIETIVRLAAHPNIAAVKEAAGSVDRVSAIRNACHLPVLSGDDSLTLPMMMVGAVGVISVASNIIPEAIVQLVQAARRGDWPGAQAIHQRYYPVFRDLFIETNPVPVKAAMAMLGWVEPVYRLPLCELSPAQEQTLRRTLQQAGILS
ncbi:MAG: 4-hydroxy-tetrahydrodipicolinate synthase [Lentisphaerae bacterium RIFOXYC12_FULL_60_16]|nr:MAG: 4-hydroxy-tetrahydrodipicolinate synthase [Lentisphaerae bacterium RIFOXYC12_FULL_60_16]